jgi:flavin reductase (DIM6/NTAB) family NADH-FMN oxidoreductase RutF
VVPVATPDGLRRAFRRHAAGVCVVTAMSRSGPVGLTVTSLTCLSAEPPRVTFNIAHGSSCWPTLSLARYVGVHLLAADQPELAATFARSGADRFGSATAWWPGPRRVPVLQGCLAWMVGVVEQRIAVGDHAIVVVRLVHLGQREEGQPLVHQDGSYRWLAATSRFARRPPRRP